MFNLYTLLSTNTYSTSTFEFHKEAKFYWSLIRLFAAVLQFRLNSHYDLMKATFIFILVILEFLTSRLASRFKVNLAVILIYIFETWISSQIKENLFWLVPFSIFSQINLFTHGIPMSMLLLSTVASVYFIASIGGSLILSQLDIKALEAMISTLFQSHKVIAINLTIGLIVMNYLLINYVNNHDRTEAKMKDIDNRLEEVCHQRDQAQRMLYETQAKLKNCEEELLLTRSELDFAAKEVQELMKADDMFLTSISHELRNPLNSLIGNIELLLLEINSPKVREMLDISKICAETLLSLINNLLDIAKIKGGRLELTPTPVKILELVAKIWKMNSTKIAKKGLQGALYISTNIPSRVIIDSHRLMQILLNLLDNAVKFTNKGKIEIYVTWIKEERTDTEQDHHDVGISLHSIPSFSSCQALPTPINPATAATQKLKVTRSTCSEGTLAGFFGAFEESYMDETSVVNTLPNFKSSFITDLEKACYKKFTINDKVAEEEFLHLLSRKSFKRGTKGYLQIEVVDTGCGINPEIESKLFKPFTQGDSSITRSYGGLGLGLFITKHLLEKMEGSISTKSEKNKGTNFCLKIPCEVRDEFTLISEPAEKIYERYNLFGNNVKESSIKALVVDDNPYNQTVLQSYLKKMGIQSDTANNGLKAFELFQQNPIGHYSVIFMDLQMPVMDGLSSSRAIRKHEAEKNVINSIPIIVITGNASDFEKQECLSPTRGIRASSFFRKPFNFSECQICIEQIISEKKVKKTYNNSQRQKILIINEDILNCDTISRMLKKDGFETLTCCTGLDAMEIVRNEREIGLVIVDYGILKKIEYDLVGKLKQHYRIFNGKNLPTVGLLGYVDKEAIRNCSNFRVDSTLHIPLDCDTLIKRARKLLNVDEN